jgi:hypothetical protein
MNPIDPAELSALLDGELPARRAQEVRHALRVDPALASAFESLARLDGACKAQAAGLAFTPGVSLQRGLLRHWLWTGGVMLGLVALRLGLKLAPSPFESGVALVLFALVLGWGVKYLMEASEGDCRWLMRRPVNPRA